MGTKILLILGCAIVCAFIGGLLAGLIADLCVTWYHVSSFEGGSGYFVVFLALGGFIAGAVMGGVATGLSLHNGYGGAAALGIAVATVVSIAAVVLLLCWLNGDVPPTLRGSRVELLLEIRSPQGWEIPKDAFVKYNSVTIRAASGNHATGRNASFYFDGKAIQRLEDRSMVEAHIGLFRSSPTWLLDVTIADETVARFVMPLGKRLRREEENWSEWLPVTSQPTAEMLKSTSGFEYRYRIQPNAEWRAEQEAVLEKKRAALRERFAALAPDAPLREWLQFYHDDSAYDMVMPGELVSGAIEVVRSRPLELIALLDDPDPITRDRAVIFVYQLHPIPSEAVAPLRRVAAKIAEDARALATRTEDAVYLEDEGKALHARFGHWGTTWETLVTNGKGGVPPELQQIHDAAQRREEIGGLRSMVSLAESYKESWSVVPQQTETGASQ